MCSAIHSLLYRIERFARTFSIIDVNVYADPILDLAIRIPKWVSLRKEPTVLSVGSQYAELIFARLSRLNDFFPIPARVSPVVRMQESYMGVPWGFELASEPERMI